MVSMFPGPQPFRCFLVGLSQRNYVPGKASERASFTDRIEAATLQIRNNAEALQSFRNEHLLSVLLITDSLPTCLLKLS